MKILIITMAIMAIALVMWQSTRSQAPETDAGNADQEPEQPPPEEPVHAKIVSREVMFTLPEKKTAVCGEESIVLPQGTEVRGILQLKPSDGPLGIRDYDHPSFLSADLAFTHDGYRYQYSGLISQWDLWAPNGTQVTKEQPEFQDETGQLDGMMDGRDDWYYVLPDGSTHTNRLKYTSCQFWVMAQPSELTVKCRYYDQNSEIADYVAIFYARPLEELLLLRDTRVFRDAEGDPEDFSLHDGETITLKRL